MHSVCGNSSPNSAKTCQSHLGLCCLDSGVSSLVPLSQCTVNKLRSQCEPQSQSRAHVERADPARWSIFQTVLGLQYPELAGDSVQWPDGVRGWQALKCVAVMTDLPLLIRIGNRPSFQLFHVFNDC